MEESPLHEKAWPIVERQVKKSQKQAYERYKDLAGTGKASNDLKEIVVSTFHGRVSELFVAKDIQQWGTFGPEGDGVDVHKAQRPGDEDLLDLAAVQTLLKG
jgi:hypothetical protein